jgi:UDP-N-acetylmuramoylalanine--D-glutamate ligase
MKDLRDLHVLVLGLGESGLAMARWCARCGAHVRVWDSREAPPQGQELAEQVPQAGRLSGPLDAHALDGVQLVLKSPGLAPRDERIAQLVAAATKARVPVQGEIDLYVRALADLKAERGYAPQIVAITGTNGKTTTTAMTAQLIERTGKHVAMAGNIGPTLLATLAQMLDDEVVLGYLPDVWVLELSSFQLDSVQGFEPSAATVLNLTQDHLDWHGDMQAYAAAKARVFGRHAVMVINRDDAAVAAMVPEAPPKAPGRSRAPKHKPRRVIRFGLDAPDRPGDFGLIVEHGMAWLVRAHESDDMGRGERRAAPKPARVPSGDRPTYSSDEGLSFQELHLQRLMPADALRVRGRHNAANALAALALATAIGCPLAPMLHGLREYTGEPHRVEFIASIDGVDAFDDSKGTNVGATVAAINGLGADRAPGKLVVILGGDGKGQDFAPLVAPVRSHSRAIATLGRDAALVEQTLLETGITTQRHDTLPAATRWAFTQAVRGDAVLLSPACASLDMFRDYKHRADVFVAEVKAIAAERGEVLA